MCGHDAGVGIRTLMRYTVVIVLAMGLLLLTPACGSPAVDEGPDSEVVFRDPILEDIIRLKIDQPEGPIYASRLKEITSIRWPAMWRTSRMETPSP